MRILDDTHDGKGAVLEVQVQLFSDGTAFQPQAPSQRLVDHSLCRRRILDVGPPFHQRDAKHVKCGPSGASATRDTRLVRSPAAPTSSLQTERWPAPTIQRDLAAVVHDRFCESDASRLPIRIGRIGRQLKLGTRCRAKRSRLARSWTAGCRAPEKRGRQDKDRSDANLNGEDDFTQAAGSAVDVRPAPFQLIRVA